MATVPNTCRKSESDVKVEVWQVSHISVDDKELDLPTDLYIKSARFAVGLTRSS